MSETYFRALTTRDRVKRWDSGELTSFHGNAPGEWYTLWKSGEFSPDEYPLVCGNGTYTERARDSFLTLRGNPQGDEENRSVSELAGVCAFTNLEEALKYGPGGPNSDQDFIIEFLGHKVCDLPVEDDAVVATVERIVTKRRRVEWRTPQESP